MTERSGDSTGSNEPVRPFPLRSQQRQAPGRRDDVPQATVLIIDDEAPVRETLTEILDIHGYRFIAAGSIEEAEKVKQRLGIERIHLVIADVHLTPAPQARAGYALAQCWRVLHPQLPFILMSGDSSNQDLPDVRAGALQFLLKPFAIDVFVAAVREALGR
jgi:DNA-binding NtrC family response regulator